ncbi:Inherit from COG: Ankyrin Repeat [Seminavis robusta]|uniref:Inherit from COG: Ankyrin Repeat n=1 Tax=Seminavis robusta TaxID=568900 RepID=A0A9N8HWG3_9STRA|nr:Inherit from COG: Ankyrin Repeat [Seminavis robusta]|eukprot:Sro1971_g308600.1 Inherit from COG: Ankyrin Repeat (234) ;mRNA; f:14620-15321
MRRDLLAAVFLLPRSVVSLVPVPTATVNSSSLKMSSSSTAQDEYYRKEGVRITHDPYAPGMAEKYGLPGQADPEGFDPCADTVGASIYGGSVQRDPTTGQVVIGEQYQNHNHRPGPVYDGSGYSMMSRAIHAGPDTVKSVLKDFPELKEEISTGGARPLHMCGMSQKGQISTQVLIDAGADISSQYSYGYTPTILLLVARHWSNQGRIPTHPWKVPTAPPFRLPDAPEQSSFS